MTTVQFIHPDAYLFADTGRGVVDTYLDVVSGDYSAVVDLCAGQEGGEKIPHPESARQTLRDAARATGHVFANRAQFIDSLRGRMVGDDFVFEVPTRAYVMEPLDLFMRILCGQWDQADFVARLASVEMGDADPFALNSLRRVVSRTFEPLGKADYRPLKVNEFPGHPHASIGIAEAVPAARLAYHGYKLLGGGTPGGPTFSLPHAALIVEVDGEPVNDIRQY